MAPTQPPHTWHVASSACPPVLLVSDPRRGPYSVCQAKRSATHLTPNIPSTTVLESRLTHPKDTGPDPTASEWGLSWAPEIGEGPGTSAWSHHQALTGGGRGLAEQKAYEADAGHNPAGSEDAGGAMRQVAALAGGRTNADPPRGLWRAGSLYHACQGPARLFQTCGLHTV